MPIQKIKSGRVNYPDVEAFVGDNGIIFFDESDGALRLGDGITPGGIPLSVGGGGDGSGYVLPTATASVKGGVKIDGTTIQINNQVISVLNGVFTTGSYSNPSWIVNLAYSKLTGAPSLSSVATSGSYTDLSNRPTIPTNTNQLTNGAGFITSSALSGLATETYVTTRGYLTEVPEAAANVKGGIKLGRGLTKDVNGVVDAFSGSYNDLTDKPTIPTDINQLTDTSGLLSGGGGGSGTNGVGISNVSVNESGRLIVTLTDNSTIDAGYVVGPQGQTGATGPQGLKGDTGDQGPQGIQGIQGIQGETGATGPQGEQGIQGIQGEQGLKGDTGDQGPAGANGSNGVGVSTASIDESGNLIITLTDASTINTGNVYANTGNITFAATIIDTSDSSAITFTPAVSFDSDITVENDLIVRNQIRTAAGDLFVTESFVETAIQNVIGSAPQALDTLQELAAALNNDQNFASTILNLVSGSTNTVRYDIDNQNLTAQQKQNARTNIDAVDAAEVYAISLAMG